MYKEIKDREDKDLDPKIISWERTSRGNETPLMYLYPKTGDNLKEKKGFSVKDYEKALFYSGGKLVGVLGGGLYEIDKKAKIKGTEIVWIDTSIIEIPWGIPQSSGIPTKDGFIIGIHGDLKIKINDVKTFYSELVSGTKIWLVKDLRDWLMSLLHTSLRDILKKYEAKFIILEEREHLINLITMKTTEELLRYGLELESLNILGMQLPDGVETLYKLERETSKIGEEIEFLKLKGELETQKREFESIQKEFERQQAELDARAKLTEKKYSVEATKLEKEVLVDLLGKEEKAKVAGEISKIGASAQKDIKIAELLAEADKKIETRREEKRKEIEIKIAEIKNKINEFDELLKKGKISEETYKTRILIFERELKELRNKLVH